MEFGLAWTQVVVVVVATTGIYLTFLVLIRIFGQRALANMSSFDFAAAIALGAVMGRVVLDNTPTLLAGVIGLVTLFVLQAVFGLTRRNPAVDATLNNTPILLMVDGQLLDENLRRARIVENELRGKLRLAGIRRYEDVACVILERTGAVSVLKCGETISAELVADVSGSEAFSALIDT